MRDTHCVTMVDIVPEEQCEVRNNWFFEPVCTVQCTWFWNCTPILYCTVITDSLHLFLLCTPILYCTVSLVLELYTYTVL